MPLARRTFLAVVAGSAGAVACSGTPSDGVPVEEGAPVNQTTAASRAARRLLPQHWQQLRFETTGPAEAATFRVSGRTGRITIAGGTPGTQLAGLRWYLKHVTHANISWAGEQLDLPEELPGLDDTVTGQANVPHLFVLNDTNDGYTGAYDDWSYWERELDILALHGYNEVLVITGADALYHRMFQGFGYTDEELRKWVPGPAHQTWWLLQNLSTFPYPVSRQLLDARAARTVAPMR
jgi:alpha-N-acetylglucosaminidase